MAKLKILIVAQEESTSLFAAALTRKKAEISPHRKFVARFEEDENEDLGQ